MQRLASYAWPGNIRELQNVIERAVVLSNGPLLTIEPEALAMPGILAVGVTRGNHATAPARRRRLASLDETERRHITKVLAQTRGVIEGPGGAAKILNLHPNTLRSRMKKLGVTQDGPRNVVARRPSRLRTAKSRSHTVAGRPSSRSLTC